MSENISKSTKQSIQTVNTLEELDGVRVELLGRKSDLAQKLRSLGELEPSVRAETGAALNTLKKQIEDALELRKAQLLRKVVRGESEASRDFTRPSLMKPQGHLHPVVSMMDDLIDFFRSLGFKVADGPEIEDEWHCFGALNIPEDHPARDMQDTFYLEDGRVPRTHTSSVQVRYMENNQPPIRIISPGRVYRNEDEDATHLWAFNQLEALVVDKKVTLGDLKGTLLAMSQHIFGDDVEIRLRPNYFPYVEPALELDVRYTYEVKQGSHSKRVKSDWLELLGSGMVHPAVFDNCKIDSSTYSGFAFGVGIERLVAIRHNLEDIRVLWRPDFKFLEKF